MAVNAHRAFNCANEYSFLKRLKVPEDVTLELRSARDDIRTALKEGLRDWKRTLTNEMFESNQLAIPSTVGSPKFRMQGSWSYHTANDPAQKPPQEIDLDDGMFLPVSFFSQNGAAQPSLISSAYFAAVETALAPLCIQKNWQLNVNKASCVRVHVNSKSHVDIALYAVPDGEFMQLVETDAHNNKSMSLDEALDSIELSEDVYLGLAADQMMLAHREKGWMPSDPRTLEDWFKEAVAEKGDQVRLTSRYLKAWRDEEWEAGRLSSIALMSAVVTVFEDYSSNSFKGRDDLALLAIAERLPTILSQRIPNPKVPGVFLDDGWSHEERADFVASARELHACLNNAIQVSNSPTTTIEKIRERLGHRFPDDVTLIVNDDQSTNNVLPAATLAGLFHSENADDRPPVQQDGDERYG